MDVRTIILLIIIILGVLSIIYIVYYNNLQAYQLKINEAESIIDELLRKKYDLFNLIKGVIIEETELTEKNITDIKKIKESNISSFDFERKLTEFNILVDTIKNDHDNLNSDVRFANYYNEIYEINEKLEASKSFYNKYTSILNKTIKRFPSSIIAIIHHIKVKTYFDGKDMFDDDLKDFKI